MKFSAILFAISTTGKFKYPSSWELLTADSSHHGAVVNPAGWVDNGSTLSQQEKSLLSLALLRMFCVWCKVIMKRLNFIRFIFV